MCEPSQPTTVGHSTSTIGQLAGASADRGCRRQGHQGRLHADGNRELAPPQTIGRTPNAQGTPIQDVRVNHRHADIRMAEQFLNRSNMVAVLEADASQRSGGPCGS
jgi:hypothetical protein